MRQLNVDMSSLRAAVEMMGAEQVGFDIGRQRTSIPQIEIDLGKGIEMRIEDVDRDDGLLSVEGRQVLLYIQDHGPKVEVALEDGSQGRRFHVADCQALQHMREKGRFERYVVTNRLDGDFYISGLNWRTRKEREGWTRLRVCQYCLNKLNYKGARGGNARVVAKNFDIGKFFEAYSSFFPYMPERQAGNSSEEGYSADWAQVASRYKADKEFRCESCKVVLADQRQLLHVHHKNGVKGDNRRRNLMALCAACHREQANHGHMFVPHEAMQKINHLRHAQGLVRGVDWAEAFGFCDPSLHGVLHAYKAKGKSVPEIGYDIKSDLGEVIGNLEIAWPQKMRGVAIAEEDREAAEKAGWRVLSMMDALDEIG